MGHIIFKLGIALITHVIWAIGLQKGVGIAIPGLWGLLIFPVISFLPFGTLINLGLMAFGAYNIYTIGLSSSVATLAG